jgi:hypothetical protein
MPADLGEGRTAQRKVFVEGLERPPDQPGLAVQTQFRADVSHRHLVEQRAPLRLGPVAVFAQAIPQQPAEGRLAAAMADLSPARAVVRRPDDIEARPQLEVADFLARLFPENQPPHPKERLRPARCGRKFQRAICEQVRLQGLSGLPPPRP